MENNQTDFGNARIPSKLIPDEVFTDLLLLWPIILLLICPFGLWANWLVIRTFLRMGLTDSVSISFFCLGLSDFGHVFFPLINIATYVLNFTEKRFQTFFRVPSLLIFYYVTGVGTTFTNLTMFITTFLALQRCLCIVKPLHFKEMFTKKRTWYVMGGFLILSSVSPIAYSTSYGIAELINPYTNVSRYIVITKPWFDEVNNYIGMPIFTIIPLVSLCLVIVSVIVMSCALKASVKFRKNTSQKSNNNTLSKKKPTDQENGENERQVSKERTAIIQVVLLSTIFVVTNLPKAALSLGAVTFPDLWLTQMYENIFRVFIAIRLSSDYLNSAVNFFIYYKYNSSFRKLCFAGENKRLRRNT